MFEWIGAHLRREKVARANRTALHHDHEEKRAAARERRQQQRREQIRQAELKLSRVDRYIFGVTGEDVVNNQAALRRRARAAAAEGSLSLYDVLIRGRTGDQLVRHERDAQRAQAAIRRAEFAKEFADDIREERETRGYRWYAPDRLAHREAIRAVERTKQGRSWLELYDEGTEYDYYDDYDQEEDD